MVAFFMKTVAGQGGQLFLPVKVFPLAAVFLRLQLSGQSLLPNAQQLFGHANEIVLVPG